ncbi:hypothetical protein LWI29_014236 [Acer saccharum]|uniref:acetate--CoA ligase n=1 Tax=Acer saccharum TaxID=4024 RepID=A0AA39S864_ACESA|nr:hypothetical protein LWI29_014236 [Acer saccharum]
MNAEEIAKLCESMSLKEREGPVRTLKADLKVAGHTTNECPEKPTGPTVLKGEELPFGFWMRALVIAKKQGYWGRHREGSEGGSRINWRSMDRTVEDKGGGRVSEEFFDRQRAQPFLATLASEENDLVCPSKDFSNQALIPSPQKYLEMYKRSIEDPSGFCKGNIDNSILSGSRVVSPIFRTIVWTETLKLDWVIKSRFTEKLANYLKDIGVKNGDAIVVYLPMLMELPITMLACARIGAVHSKLLLRESWTANRKL